MGSDSDNKSSGSSEESKFVSYPAFQEIRKVLAQDGANIVKKVKGVICFKVTKGPGGQEGTWYVDAKNGSGAVKFGGKDKADVTITVSDEDLLKMMTGQLDTVKAFFQKKLKVSGNMGLAMKVKELQRPAPKAKL